MDLLQSKLSFSLSVLLVGLSRVYYHVSACTWTKPHRNLDNLWNNFILFTVGAQKARDMAYLLLPLCR